jgi:hypothetical protein
MSRLWGEDRTEEEEAWERYVRACDTYFKARRLLFDTDPLPFVRAALQDGGELFVALHLLEDVGWNRPELVKAVVPELYPYTLSLGRPGIFSRLVLGRLSRAGTAYAEDLHARPAPLVAGRCATRATTSSP